MPSVFKAVTGKPRRLTKTAKLAIAHAARHNFIQDLTELHALAHRLGLHVTGHALHRAVKAVGYEVAGDVEQAGRASRDERE